jgi:flavin reductase (DIM6/NTAB) family NADH-FMN oxidoreductase RutF
MIPTITAPHVPVAPKILYFGTPVVLISTENPDGSSNLAPISSAWALGKHVVVGLGRGGQSLENLERTGECVLNLPSPELWQAVERLAPLTGKNPVPAYKAAQFRYESDKFGAAGLTPVPAEHVRPARVLECPLQIEGRVVAIHSLGGPDGPACAVEVEALQTYADPRIVLGPNHIDPTAWSPLIYNFRHYFGLGAELGRTFRADTPR